MRSASERIGLPSCSQVSLLVVEISPDLITAIFHVLTSSSESTGLTHFVLENLRSGFVKYQTGKGRKQLQRRKNKLTKPIFEMTYFKGCYVPEYFQILGY